MIHVGSVLHVGPVEAVWLAASVVGLVLNLWAYSDARKDKAAVHALNGKARELTAAGDLRAAKWFAALSGVLVGVVVPQLFSEREIVLTPGLVAFMSIPFILAYVAFRARLDRRALLSMKTEEIAVERRASQKRIENGLARLEHAAEVNLEAVQHAAEASESAAEAANQMNEKWLAGQERADASEQRAAEREVATDEYNVGADVIRRDTSDKVTEMHDRTDAS